MSDIQLNAASVPGATILWSSSLATSTIDNVFGFAPIARVLDNTTFTAVITTGAGCTASGTVNVTVVDDYKVTPPILFSPNGDGVNDKMVIANLDAYPLNSLVILDKKGKLVYQATNYANGWNGIIAGKPIAVDTYFYILTVNGKVEKHGSITVAY